jgi:hypothetical protein
MLDPTARPAPVPGYDLESLDDEVVLYHAATEMVFYCNPTAALIFRLCDGSRSVAEISRLLGEAYPEAKEQIAREVGDTVDQLLGHGALVLT